MEATPDTADYEQLRAGLPLGGTPSSHDLDSPALEAAFGRLAIDHPEAVTPSPAPAAGSKGALKAPARSRRRITELLDQLVGQPIAEVRITPVRGGVSPMCVMLLSPERKEIPLPKGGAAKICRGLTAALPKANWGVAQDYDTSTGQLTRHIFAIPAALQGGTR
ncbi:hypothetical protein ACFRFJ_15655 [Streptomyces hydrogenans]|uniref:hypothetical protein n=1 Tax=Streptomyces hydrogenans TaxID=1873719 RepID=UPI0036CBEB51